MSLGVSPCKFLAMLFALTVSVVLLTTSGSASAAGPYLTDASTIAAGQQHSCAIRKARPEVSYGQVVCWGRNISGALGNGTTTDSNVPVAVKEVGWTGSSPHDGLLRDVSQIGAGRFHTCAVKVSGQVVCWGHNFSGEVGDGTNTNQLVPMEVKGVDGIGTLNGITQLSVGLEHNCALKADTQVACWGRNGTGALGDGNTTNSSVPVLVKGVGGIGSLSGVTEIGTGSEHSCAVRNGGGVVCWGFNWGGALGDGTGITRTSPVEVKQLGWTGVPPDDGTLENASSLALGTGHSCALLVGGQVTCWGNNTSGKLGDGTETTRPTPVLVHGVNDIGYLENITQITAGHYRTCAVRADRQVVCWGNNVAGQIGDGTTSESFLPVPVKGIDGIGELGDIAQISAGDLHTCAVMVAGDAICWGLNDFGALGDGNTVNSSVPRRVLLGERLQFALTVAKTGSGSGLVSSNPGGIDCGSTCQAEFEEGTTVTLVADPDSGSIFKGWTGGCSGTALTCTIEFDRAFSVSAEFLAKHSLSVTRDGDGSGLVESSPLGIACDPNCEAQFDHGTVVTLTASPTTGSTFKGWSGACSGISPTCSVTMEESVQANATFEIKKDAYFDGKILTIRLKCGPQYRPACRMITAPVTSKGKKAKVMAKPLRKRIKASRWVWTKFVIKPKYRARVKQMSNKNFKTLYVRQRIKSKRIGKRPFRKVMKKKKRKTAFHRYIVFSVAKPDSKP